MPPKKSKTDGEEKAKPLTTASSRVTRSMGRRTRSETQQNGAKAAGSASTPVKVASPKKAKRKKPAIETGKAKKGKKEDEAVEEVEKEAEEETEAEPEPEVEDPTKTKIVIEHCKQCNAFKTRAIQVKEGLEGAVTGCTVTLNPEKPRRGCFEIRKEGGETFISLLEMKRPFAPMKALDMEQVIEDIIKKIK
ncbi:PREDICTED: selenoprotein H-like [Camelina sativa]|uniref:Selenoprotein H-like n=1 Tax=Camelina sativa TaxID=90675 RepID=A0ABM1QQ49_CAMSA|nr:PREDICTED: selenoprotein H-like [Camelina sativa]